MDYKPPSEVCSNPECENQRREGQRTCPECHAKYMRQWRKDRRQALEELVRGVRVRLGTR